MGVGIVFVSKITTAFDVKRINNINQLIIRNYEKDLSLIGNYNILRDGMC